MIAQGAVGVVGAEDPVFDFGAHEARAGAVFAASSGRSPGKSTSRAPRCSSGAGDFGRLDFGDAELAGRDIDMRQAGAAIRRAPPRPDSCSRASAARCASIAVPGVTTRVTSRFTSFLPSSGVFHLIADGDAIALLDQPRDVAFGGVIGHAAHGNGCAFFLVARGERDFEFARGGDGVFEEELVEIAQAEHQQRVRDLLFDGVILPHQRRGGISHESRIRPSTQA